MTPKSIIDKVIYWLRRDLNPRPFGLEQHSLRVQSRPVCEPPPPDAALALARPSCCSATAVITAGGPSRLAPSRAYHVLSKAARGSRWPLPAAVLHVSLSHGQQPSCRAHCSTARWPRRAAVLHVCSTAVGQPCSAGAALHVCLDSTPPYPVVQGFAEAPTQPRPHASRHCLIAPVAGRGCSCANRNSEVNGGSGGSPELRG